MQNTFSLFAIVAPFGRVESDRTRGILLAFALAVAVALTNASAASAQTIAPVGVLRSATSIRDTVPHIANPGDDPSSKLGILARVGLGIVGTFGGAFAGGVTGAAMAQGCHGEDCQFGGLMTGAAVGSVLGAAMASAIPELGSGCGAGGRIATGVAGSVVGALLGGVVGGTAGGGVLFGFLTGSGVGSGIGASLCR